MKLSTTYITGFAALLTGVMAACSDSAADEPYAANTLDSNVITYNPTTTTASRTSDANIYSSTNAPSEFYVWALENKSGKYYEYFEGDRVTRGAASGQGWVGSSNNAWPDDGTLSFIAIGGLSQSDLYSNGYDHIDYAGYSKQGTGHTQDMFSWLKPGSSAISNDNVKPHIYVVIPTEASSQKDIIYAVKNNQTKAANASTGVALNFRHALSQHIVKIQVDNPTIYVVVKSVTIHNLFGGGHLYFYTTTSSGDTDDQIVSGSSHDDFTSSDGYGVWDYSDYTTRTMWYNQPLATIKSDFLAGTNYVFKFNSGNGTTIVNGTPQSADEAVLLRDQFIMKSTLAGNTTRSSYGYYGVWNAKASVDTDYDVYWDIDCAIYNKADINATPNTSNDVLIYSGHVCASPGVQVTSESSAGALIWDMGRKYTHIFHFGAGDTGGGYKDGDITKPVLTALKYSCDVTEWVDFGNANFNLNPTN